MEETIGKLAFPTYFTRYYDLKVQGWGVTADVPGLKTFKYFSCLIKEVDYCMNAGVNSGGFSVSFPTPYFNYAFSLCTPLN